MVYILGTEISDKKSITFALGSIYGIGLSKSRALCRKLGFVDNLTISDLSQVQISELVKTIQASRLLLTNDLKKFQLKLLYHKVDIKSYKGLRRIRGLPIRGQRTRTNARNAKRFKRE
jgi:small subunit ribosomal protein S13